MKQVVLMFHGLVSDEFKATDYAPSQLPMTIAETTFMHWLDLLDEKKLNPLFTFDDNLACHIRTAKILARRNIQAIFFITTSDLNQKGTLSTSDVETISDLGHKIGSHSDEHIFLDSCKDLKSALKSSRDKLQDVTKKDINTISFPGGRYNNQVIRECIEAGYSDAYTSEIGINQPLRKCGDLSLWERVAIKSGSSDDFFLNAVSANSTFYRKQKIFAIGKKLAKNLIGSQNYHKLWKLLQCKRCENK